MTAWLIFACTVTHFTCCIYADELSINIASTSHTIGERGTARFNATASGINMNNFMYQWKKRDSHQVPNKALGVNELVLTIPNLIISDGGQYYCIVTNEWGRSTESNNVMLIVEGTYYIVLNLQFSMSLHGHNMNKFQHLIQV